MGAGIAALACVVLSLTDGDTLRANCELPEGSLTIAVRLAEIDAPERHQPYGPQSKASLAELCLGRAAVVKPLTHDRWGRTVARVTCDGVDANARQVELGMAWAFTRYVTDPAIVQAEEAARAAKVGLWADPDPVPPWVWRLDHRPQKHAPEPPAPVQTP